MIEEYSSIHERKKSFEEVKHESLMQRNVCQQNSSIRANKCKCFADVLVIDDNNYNLEAAKLMIEMFEYGCNTATGG